MKKIVFLSISLLFLASCNKDYYCVCQFYNEEGQAVGVPSEHHSAYYKRKDKDKAEAECVKIEQTPTYSTTTRKCQMK